MSAAEAVVSMKRRILRLILGDQVNIEHSWFKEDPSGAEYVLMEVREEATYVKHHIQKIIAFFLAMRAFAEELKEKKLSVLFIHLDDPTNRHSFVENIKALVDKLPTQSLSLGI